MKMKSHMILVPLLAVLLCPAPPPLSQGARVQAVASTPSPAPSAIELYGRPSYKTGSPIPTPLDNYFSGANQRPSDLNRWYGNGYNW